MNTSWDTTVHNVPRHRLWKMSKDGVSSLKVLGWIDVWQGKYHTYLSEREGGDRGRHIGSFNDFETAKKALVQAVK